MIHTDFEKGFIKAEVIRWDERTTTTGYNADGTLVALRQWRSSR